MEKHKEAIIELVKDFYIDAGKVTLTDLEKQGITYQEIRENFNNFQNLLLLAGINKKYRKKFQTDEEIKIYLQEIKIVEKNNCWVTNRSTNSGGYVKIKYKNKTMFLHRLSYYLFKGELTPNKVVMHQCNNRKCFNPDHLELGTPRENSRYISEQGRRNISGSLIKGCKDHKLRDPYDYPKILEVVRSRISITEKNEWLYKCKKETIYPRIRINNICYTLHRLILANKIGKKYEDVEIACHRLPDGSKPKKNDVNPEHLFEGNSESNSRDTLKYNSNYDLTEDKVKFILEELVGSKPTSDFGDFDRKMAEKVDVSSGVIRQIRLGTSYKEFQLNNKIYKSKKEKSIIQLDMDRNIIAKFKSATDAARILTKTEPDKYTQCSIAKACNGDLKTYKGFYWEFEHYV